MRWSTSRFLLIPIVCFAGLYLPAAQPQTLSLAELPYRDPRPLDALLARDEASFNTAIERDWQQTAHLLETFVPTDIPITPSSLFFNAVRQRCTQGREAFACRLYMDFLSFLMKQKRAAPPLINSPLPVVLRPAQLPSKNSAVLEALARLDTPVLQSALASHWDWVHNIIERYLPDHFSLYPISKVFDSIRDTCRNERTEIACRLHLADIDTLVDSNRQQVPTLFRTLSQLPYRDPAPLNHLLALTRPQWDAQQARWADLNALLNRYIAWQIAIVGDPDFARARLDCQGVMPGDYLQCRNYLSRLSALMRGKRRPANPFLSLRTDTSQNFALTRQSV